MQLFNSVLPKYNKGINKRWSATVIARAFVVMANAYVAGENPA